MNIKNSNPDCIVLFRMGDFYETFFEDAKTIARELEITLTSRGKGESKAPLAGIPYHSIGPYIAKLIKKGYKIAIVEQVEDPKKAKGLVKRDLVRIITPGTVFESLILDESNNNYILAFTKEKDDYGISFCDVSTGEFFAAELNPQNFSNEIKKLSPAEIIFPMSLEESQIIQKLKENNFILHSYDDRFFYDEKAKNTLNQHFNTLNLNGFGISSELALISAGALLSYIKETQMNSLQHITKLSPYSLEKSMCLDSSTIRNLELLKNIITQKEDSTLLSVLDRTVTPMGKRKLRRWITSPLIDKDEINQRLDAVEELKDNIIARQGLRSLLDKIYDIERLIGRVSFGNANPKDLVCLKLSLENIPKIRQSLQSSRSSLLKNISEIPTLEQPKTIINNSIKDEPNTTIREGNIIKKGYNKELDELREITHNTKTYLAELEEKERERTNIKSLKIKYNKVFGYYIEVTKSNLHLVPDDYIRKQTQVNSERYITEELKEKESKILGAQERIFELEYELFLNILEQLKQYIIDIQKNSDKLALLDCIISFAETAQNNNYTRPIFNNDGTIQIEQARHPVIEEFSDIDFVPNSCNLTSLNRTMIITGPNMAGKCLIGESIIYTDQGMIPIKHFKPANLVREKFSPLVLGIVGKNGKEKTSHFYYDGKKPTIKITTKFGYEIEGTYNHPILVRTDEGGEVWKKLSDIKDDDFIIISRDIDQWGKKTEISKKIIDEVKSYNYRNTVLQYNLPHEIDKDLAYLIGLLVGDGTLTYKSYITLSNIDKELINSFSRIILEKFGYKVKKKSKKMDFYISSRQIRLFFEKIGLGYENALRKQIPYSILQAPKHIMKAFLSGLYDTDGDVDKRYGNVHLSTSSEKMAKQIQLILLNFGIVSSLRPKKTKVNMSYRISIYGENAILFHKLIGFRLKRKQIRKGLASKLRMPNYGIPCMKNILKEIQSRIVKKQDKKIALKKVKNINSIFYTYIPSKRNISFRKLKELIDYCKHNDVKCNELDDIHKNNYFYDSIKKIQKINQKKDVYDFTVPKSHSFVGNGFVNHNSTYMRQGALIILMAQIGSFVPAKKASLPIHDRIFSRVGAYDDLVSGQSTFMVEMTETANILNNATKDSFIILDEIGRGTSTYDGLSLAWAITEYLHDEIKAKTLFATHYHHLNKMAEKYKGIKNYHILVDEAEDRIIFLRKIEEGGTDKSYGIEVAKLAGIPKEVIDSSKKIMNLIEIDDEVGEMIHKELKKGKESEPEPKEQTPIKIQKDSSLNMFF